MKIKYIIIGSLLFVVFYLEPLEIGPLKFAHLWKIPLLIYLLVSIKFRFQKDKITKFSSLYYIKYTLTSGFLFLGYYIDGLLMFARGVSIPIVNNYLNVKKIGYKKLIVFLDALANFVILSSIPFLLNLIEPLSRGYVLDNYGLDEKGFVGLFQNPHGAAIIISQALLIKVFFMLKFKRLKVLQIVIIGLGLFIMYKTYVRTGYLMFFLGITVIVYLEFGIKRLYRAVPLIGALIIFAAYFYSKDTVLQGRVAQQNIYSSDRDEQSIDQISSGRLTLSLVNLESYWESNIWSKLFGMGLQYSTDEMYKKIGMRKVSHNGFVDALVHNGLIGLILYLLFLKAIYTALRRNRQSVFYNLGMASLIAYLIFILFQGGNVFLLEIQLLVIVNLVLRPNQAYLMQYRQQVKI